MQESFTSSSLNKRAQLHLFAQIFPLPMEKMFHFYLPWIYFPGGGGAQAALFSLYFTFQ